MGKNLQQTETSVWAIALPAVALLAIAMASRGSFGLFVSPINTSTGLGVATISFAIALSQLAWGIAQPIAGGLADRYGAARVIAISAVALAVGHAVIPFASTSTTLFFALALIGLASAGAGGNAVLLGAVSRRVTAEQRGLAGGLVGAGGPIGQLVFAPGMQVIIATSGWMPAMFTLAVLPLAALPLATRFRAASPADSNLGDARRTQAERAPREQVVPATTAFTALRGAMLSASYWYVTMAFFVCGFHVSFLLAHMPGVIELCGLSAAVSGASLAVMGLFNIASSVVSGLVIQRFPMRLTLAAIYALRGLGIAVFLMIPKTEITLLAFAIWMGLTYMATLPPTAGLIGRLFGTHHMGTLLGATMFVHQIGSFLGVWLGGVMREVAGGYDWVWRLDIFLAAAAALICLAIREGSAESSETKPLAATEPRQATTG